MSKMHEHVVLLGLCVAKREGSKVVIGNISFLDAIIHGLSTPKVAVITRNAS